MALIEPRTLKGFRDYLPEQMIPRERLVETARKVYRSYGFLPIDTPALEYEEILTGKGGEESDKQLYAFEDHGGRRVALRFDLTVPLARFVAQHSNELGMPFKRYHIASVWRGENTQRGRYREFMQCDFDTIGVEHLAADIEVGFVIHDLLRAIGFDDFRIRVNNRKLLTGVLERLELAGKLVPVLRAIDKLDKIGPDKVAEEIVREAGTTADQARRVLAFASLRESLGAGATDDALLEALRPHVQGSERAEAGLAELATLVATTRSAGIAAERLSIDLSIARGLDYYTGTVYETVLGALPGIGSVCSGGRYDNLAQLYTKERLPGIGASLGLDRLLAAMEELGLVEKRRSSAPIFVPFFDAGRLPDYLALCRRLRAAGFGVEFYPEPKKLGAQLKYADRRGFRVALVLGDEEWKNGAVQVKELATQTSRVVPLAELERELGAFRE